MVWLPAGEGVRTDSLLAPRENVLPRKRASLYSLLTANGISGFGNEMTAVAVPWFVLQTTGSPARTGLVAFAMLVPFVVATFFGGVIVDRVGFWQTSILADLASGLTVAMIPLLYLTVGLPYAVLLLLVFFGTLLDAPGATARQSMIPEISRDAGMSLERANSVFESVQQLKNLLGPLTAGLLIVAIGASNVLWVDAVTFAVSAALVWVGIPRMTRKTAAAAKSARLIFAEVAEGVRFIRDERVVLAMALVSLVGNFILIPVFLVLMPVYARDVLGSAAQLGIVIAAFGGGALVSSIVYGAVAQRVSRWIWYLLATSGVTIGYVILVSMPGVVGAVIAMAAMGVTSGGGRPLSATVRQERTPLSMRGRVFGAINALINAATPIGVVVTGLLITGIGLRATLICFAAVGLAQVLAVAILPVFRRLARPIDTPA
jgi:MFS family permease